MLAGFDLPRTFGSFRFDHPGVDRFGPGQVGFSTNIYGNLCQFRRDAFLTVDPQHSSNQVT